VFTVEDRERIREELMDAARASAATVGAALVGSAARGAEDAWSDIDLALQLAPEADEPAVVEEWSALIAERFGLADRFDVFAAERVRYRVFLLPSSLQIDVSFWPHDRFRATEEGFRLIFGTPAEPTSPPAPDVDSIIGMAWLYALHARSALGRGRTWQAVMMLDDLRNQVVALSCVRLDLNPWHGRDADRLPDDERAALVRSRAADVTPDSLATSLQQLVDMLRAEVGRHDPGRAASLRGALRIIAG
jgi:predicted nucleotidyltransferase